MLDKNSKIYVAGHLDWWIGDNGGTGKGRGILISQALIMRIWPRRQDVTEAFSHRRNLMQ
jgi:hypothetical protein